MSISIRPAVSSDALPATEVIRAAYAPWAARLDDLPDVTAGVTEDISEGLAWVAQQDGQVIGVVIAFQRGAVLHVANLAVSPDAGGQGIGSALMGQVEAAARSAGVDTMRLATHRAMAGNVAFYERLGWQVTGHEGNKVLMARALPSPGRSR